ncbi:MAG: acyl carrier protein [Candidatus Rokuibacteriota bacterium]
MSTVEEVVSHVFGVDPDSVDASSSPETVEGWDSMGHLNLVAALEKRFNVSIDIGDTMEMASVQRIREILLDYGVRG